MSSPFEDFIYAELPNRPTLLQGTTDATGEPTNSVLTKVNLAPTGTLYLQDEVNPKVLWYKYGATSAAWRKVGAGGGGLAATDLDSWDLDAGSQPIPFSIGNFVADSFDGHTDIAIYTEETMGIAYDPNKSITFRYQYSMSGTSTDQVDISVGYAFQGNSFSPAAGYTEVPDSFNGEGDTDVHTRSIVIPAQASLTDERPIMSLRFRRLGNTDPNTEDFNLFSTIIYQD